MAFDAIRIDILIEDERALRAGEDQLDARTVAMRNSSLGNRDQEPNALPDNVRAAYRFSVKRLLELAPEPAPETELEPAVVGLSPMAKTKIKEFMAWIELQLAEEGELGSMTDWAGKLAGAALRIAGILHAMEYVGYKADGTAADLAERLITEDVMKRAIRIAHYYRYHAQAAFAEMGADSTVEDAKHVLRWIERKGVSEFTRRDAFEGTKGKFHKVTQMEPALELLVAHGHIREKAQEHQGKGRPSVSYEVNPLEAQKIMRISHSQKSQNSQK